jgi:hexosaminidase
VPEIEMPGHSTAALAAYPELSCYGGPYFTDMSSNTSAGVFCAGKEETFEFLQNVLIEVMELFPGEYVHIGGDEVPKQNWKNCPRCQARIRAEGLKDERELQSYFIRRVATFLAGHRRRPIGWSEIREGGIPPGAALMDWIGGGEEAAAQGHDVVMTPDAFCYFDFYQSRDRKSEPAAVGGYLPLQKVYSFEPLPQSLAAGFKSHILGAQANVWTEYIPSFRQVEYMTFPRLCSLAEVVWSPKSSRSWEDFSRRLQTHLQRLDQLNIDYRRKEDW